MSVVEPCQQSIDAILANNNGNPLNRQQQRVIEKCQLAGSKPDCVADFEEIDRLHYEPFEPPYVPANQWDPEFIKQISDCKSGADQQNPLPPVPGWVGFHQPTPQQVQAAEVAQVQADVEYEQAQQTGYGYKPYSELTAQQKFEGAWNGGAPLQEYIDPAILSEGKYNTFMEWAMSVLNFNKWIISIFLILHIFTMIGSTISEIFGVKITVGSRITVLIFSLIQIVVSFIAIYFKQTNISISLWIGLVFYGIAIITSSISAFLIDQRRRKKDVTRSQIFDIIGITLKSIQALVAVIFCIIFAVTSKDKMSNLKMYSVITIAFIELIMQIISFFGLI
jgi:hypothetical protein